VNIRESRCVKRNDTLPRERPRTPRGNRNGRLTIDGGEIGATFAFSRGRRCGRIIFFAAELLVQSKSSKRNSEFVTGEDSLE
jgi:hypothetical protein